MPDAATKELRQHHRESALLQLAYLPQRAVRADMFEDQYYKMKEPKLVIFATCRINDMNSNESNTTA